MLTDKMEKALNDQLNAELYSSYLYLSMGAYFESVRHPGLANWMRVQAQEELVHAMKFFDYVNGSQGRVLLREVEAPPKEWDSELAAFKHVYQHEQKVTGLIKGLVNVAAAEKDDTTNKFLQWFVKEQVEEEESASDVVSKLTLAGSDKGKLMSLDRELAKRVFKPPKEDRK
jgi:ferritin